MLTIQRTPSSGSAAAKSASLPLHALERHGYTGQVLLSAHHAEDADDLRAHGAHHVPRPYEAAAAAAVASLTAALGTTADGTTSLVPTPPTETVERRAT